jgi:hypothetical protein
MNGWMIICFLQEGNKFIKKEYKYTKCMNPVRITGAGWDIICRTIPTKSEGIIPRSAAEFGFMGLPWGSYP